MNIKKHLLFLSCLLMAVNLSAKKNATPPSEKDMGAYVMVYHKDADHGLHMAISYDSYTWTALNNDKPVIAGDTIAMQHGIRDPHILRGPDGGFYLAMTDLHIFAQRKVCREGWLQRYSRLSHNRMGARRAQIWLGQQPRVSADEVVRPHPLETSKH